MNPQTRSAIYATAILESAGVVPEIPCDDCWDAYFCHIMRRCSRAPDSNTLPRVTTPVAKLNRELFPGLDEEGGQ